MEIFTLCDQNIPAVAKLMESLMPDWWNYQSAYDQLSDIRNSANAIGWLVGDTEQNPKGWLLCTDYKHYSCLSLECLGFNEGGSYVTTDELQPLLEKAEAYARNKKYRLLRYMIGSTRMSCYGQDISDYAQALKELKSHSNHYDYLVRYGFRATGFMPNCYANGNHAIILVKTINDIT